MPSRRFPKPWKIEPVPGGYRVVDANGMALALAHSQPHGAIALSESRLTDDEAWRIAKWIARQPELVELERDRNRARSRRKPQPLRFKPVTIGDLNHGGKLLEIGLCWRLNRLMSSGEQAWRCTRRKTLNGLMITCRI
jgi:hypothetical protein